MSLGGNPGIFGIDPYSQSSTPVHQLGAKGISPDGRIFRYAKASSTGIAVGKLCIAADITANHEDLAFATAGAIGDKSVSITVGATAVAANEYDGGTLHIIDDTGEGHTFLIEKHGASDGSEAVTFYIKPGLEVATTTSTTVTLARNKNMNVLISDGTLTDVPVGVTPIAVTASYYFWIQTGGPATCLVDANDTTAGSPITIGDTNTGAVETRDGAGEPIVGIQPAGAGADVGEHGVFFLTLDS